jgi:hypothetical protein
MKRFLVFYGRAYAETGGWNDFRASFDAAEDAAGFIQSKASNWDWWQVVDGQSGELFAQGHDGLGGEGRA